MIKNIFSSVLIAATLFGLSQEVSAAPTKITVSVPDTVDSYAYMATDEFVKRAAKYSDGSLEFELVPEGKLYDGNTSKGIKKLGAGSIQLAVLASCIYTNFVPGFNVISVPYMFDNPEQLRAFINSDIGTELYNRLNRMNITVVGKWTRSYREITTTKKQVKMPSDLNGLKFRVPDNLLFVEFFKACGATITSTNMVGVYDTLKSGESEGQENPIDVPFAFKLYEVQKYVTLSHHMLDSWVVGINTGLFNSLNAKQKEAIIKAGEEVQQWNADMMARENLEFIKKLKDKGLIVYELNSEETKAFAEVSKSCYPVFRKLTMDDRLFDAVLHFTGKK